MDMTEPAGASYSNEPEVPSPTGYLVFIEGMRGLAALYVALGHIASLVDPPHNHKGVPLWLHMALGPLAYGHLAVAAFIVISGFCLALAATQRDDPDIAKVGAFLIRRCRRILPAYYGCLAVSLAVALWVTPRGHGMPFIQYLPVTKANVLAHAFLVQNLRPDWMYKLNGVLWSIALEFQLYFLFPVLARTMRKAPWVVTLLGTVVFAVAIAYLIPRGVKLYPYFLCFFFVGMVGARYACARPVDSRPLWAGEALGFGLCIYGTCAGWSPVVTESALALFATCLLIDGAQRRTGISVTRAFEWRPLAWIGAFSYSLYLMHHPILQTADLVRPTLVHGPVREAAYLILFGIPVALLGSLGFGLLFERQWVLKAFGSQRRHHSRSSYQNSSLNPD